MTNDFACVVCKRPFYRDEAGATYCSDFCQFATPEEKISFETLKEGEWGAYPCVECGCIIGDVYNPIESWCNGCDAKIRLRKADDRIQLLEKELAVARNEAVVWKKESEAAYAYNKELNRWWQFKLERVVLEAKHYK